MTVAEVGLRCIVVVHISALAILVGMGSSGRSTFLVGKGIAILDAMCMMGGHECPWAACMEALDWTGIACACILERSMYRNASPSFA